MNIKLLNNKTFWLIAALIFLAAIYFAVYLRNGQIMPPTTKEDGISGTSTQTDDKAPISTARPGISGSGQVKAPLKIISPIRGEQWIIGQNHLISWSRETGLTGGIYLVNAVTGATAGWINVGLDRHQTSFTWNTKDVALGRTNPLRKDIGEGNYVVKIVFDGPEPTIQSETFSVVIPSHTITVKNNLFSLKTLNVKKGERVIFINNDAVDYNLKIENLASGQIPAGKSYTLETASASLGIYEFYLEEYPNNKSVLIIQ